MGDLEFYIGRVKEFNANIKPLGCAILVSMFLLRDVQHSFSEIKLADLVGFDRKTTRKHLNALKETGLVIRSHHFNGWQLTDRGYQLLLPGFETLQQPDSTLLSGSIDSKGEILPLKDGVGSPFKGEILPFKSGNFPFKGEILPNAAEKRDMSHDMIHDKSHRKEISRALAFIDNPTRRELMRLPHVTLEYAQHLRAYFERDIYPQRVNRKIGWLIEIIRNGDFPPDELAVEPQTNQTCRWCGEPATDFGNPAQPLCADCAAEAYASLKVYLKEK